MIYLDASYLAKFYVSEPDSPRARDLISKFGSGYCCQHGQVEVLSVFHRKLREGSTPHADFLELSAQFLDDVSTGAVALAAT